VSSSPRLPMFPSCHLFNVCVFARTLSLSGGLYSSSFFVDTLDPPIIPSSRRFQLFSTGYSLNSFLSLFQSSSFLIISSCRVRCLSSRVQLRCEEAAFFPLSMPLRPSFVMQLSSVFLLLFHRVSFPAPGKLCVLFIFIENFFLSALCSSLGGVPFLLTGIPSPS